MKLDNQWWVLCGFGVASFTAAAIGGTATSRAVRDWQVSVPAGILFISYLAWVSFAAVLNFAIWRLNP